MNTVVLYHDSCADGFGSAWAAWRALGDSATYIPVQYGQGPPVEAQLADRLFILDFSYPRDTILALADACDELLVLDHHKSAQEQLDGLPFARFDMEKSGAVLAWEHFHPGKPVPLLLLYLQDRDLWQWRLPHSREVSAALAIEPMDFGRWDELVGGVQEQEQWLFEWFVPRGAGILAARSKHVESLATKAYTAEIADYRVPAVNSPLFQSEIGERLLQLHLDAPFAAIFFALDEEWDVWSLRSRGDFDVSAVAKALGGGGHRAAAGFRRKR